LIDFERNYIETYTIQDAWRDVMTLCVKNGYDYVVESGSYTGQIRRQLDSVMIRIKEPWIRPLAPIMPPNIPPPTTDEKIEFYFQHYLAEDIVEENEEYTYGSFINPQLNKILNFLNISHGNSNQACITVGDKNSPFLSHAPCLKLVDFKVVNGKLNMTVFFRSWDLFTGLPENLGGLQLLKEFVLAQLTFPCIDGELMAYSSGLHIYEQYFDLVNTLNVFKIEKSEKIRLE
jgi:thymidylate synthase